MGTRPARRADASGARSVAWSTPTECALLFVRGVTVRTAGPVALVVGTILSAVNQGSTIAAGDASWLTWVRLAFNYCVPFCVASIGFLAACRVSATDASVSCTAEVVQGDGQGVGADDG